jgi:hypothetical protein
MKTFVSLKVLVLIHKVVPYQLIQIGFTVVNTLPVLVILMEYIYRNGIIMVGVVLTFS